MAVCPNCQSSVPDHATNCPQCGAVMAVQPQNPVPPQNPVQPPVPGQVPPTGQVPPAGQMPPMPGQVPPAYTPYQQPAYPYGQAPSGQTNTGLLVWSIINLVICCLPLGIAGLIFTLNAKNALNAEEEAQKLKTAKTCNLIGTIGGAVVVILYVILMMVGIFGSIAMY